MCVDLSLGAVALHLYEAAGLAVRRNAKLSSGLMNCDTCRLAKSRDEDAYKHVVGWEGSWNSLYKTQWHFHLLRDGCLHALSRNDSISRTRLPSR